MVAERAKWTFEESPDGKLVRRPSRLLELERKAKAEMSEKAKSEKKMEKETVANGGNAARRLGEGKAGAPPAAKKPEVEEEPEPGAKPDMSGLKPDKPEAKSDKPEAKPDKSEAKLDKSEAKLDKPDAKPDKPKAEPEAKSAANPAPELKSSEAQPSDSTTLAPSSSPSEHTRVDVIFNPVSGHGDVASDRETIKSVLAERFGSVNFYETTPEKTAGSLADAALADGATLVVASGGDGTVTAVAAAVRRHAHGSPAVAVKDRAEGKGTSAASLGIIPRGTANAFCAAVGIPTDVAAAARLVNGAEARPFDIAVVNGGEPMMLLAGVGLEAEAVLRADRSLKNRFGILAYVLAGARSVATQETFSASLTLRGVRQRQRVGSADAELVGDSVRLICPEVAVLTVANCAPATSVLAHGIGPVSPEDGLLNVVCVSPPRRRAMVGALVSMLWSGLVGQRSNRGDVYGLRARSVEINCEPKQRFVVDGEDCGYTPVVVELEEREDRRQINVVAPPQEPLNRQKRRLGRALGRGWRNLRGAVVLGVIVWGLRKWSAMQGEGEL